MTFVVIIAYFLLLLGVSRLTASRSNNNVFFQGERKSPWYMVAFGMVGASISGVTFVSVPGMVIHSGFSYLTVCAGFILGYIIVAYVLLPYYYKHGVTSIYTILKPLGVSAYKTGASFFLLSKMLSTGAKFFVPCYIISLMLGWQISLTILMLFTLVWLYTRRGGIKTLVWTDTLQTLCMLIALGIILYNVWQQLSPALGTWNLEPGTWNLEPGTWNLEPGTWNLEPGTLLSFLSGAFIVIVMTGLDQDMMQKNLTCKSLRDAQKDMCTYGVAFLPVNALFLALGAMLVMLRQQQGIALPSNPDDLLITYALEHAPLILLLGILSTSFSTVDSSLTALTTTFCIDICERPDDERLRKTTHIIMALLLAVCVYLFSLSDTSSLIDVIYTLVGYTYGPLLGLFSFALLHKRQTRYAPVICIVAPVICYVISYAVSHYTTYHMGYELLMLNGMLTYCGLYLTGKIGAKS